MLQGLKHWFFGLTRGKQIGVSVIGVHLLCLAALSIDFLCHAKPSKRRNVVVHTVQITPPKKQVAHVQSPSKSPPIAKKAAPTKKSAAKPQPKPKVVQDEPVAKNPSHTSLLQEIESNLDAIVAPAASLQRTNIHIPVLSENAPEQTSEGSSAEEIIAAFLSEALTLPEFGEVRASLSIDRWGHLQSCEIVSAKSEKNGAFLKNRLPQLQFPCLNEGATLTIVFSNAL